MRVLGRRLILAGMAASGVSSAGAREGGRERPVAAARLVLAPHVPGLHLPASFCGLSLETAALSQPGVLSPDNRALIALHRGIAPQGILRLGGNTSDVSFWQDTPHGAGTFPLTQERVRDLRGFVDATGWDVVWGLNLGTGTPEMAAIEAAAVTAILGPRLRAFQIGNEPDLFNFYGHTMRGGAWSFSQYMADWTRYARAILARSPQARFWGPDVALDDDWITRFAVEAPARFGGRITGLSGHYYAEGPPASPLSTIGHLLSDDPHVTERLVTLKAVTASSHLPFTMTEGGSCYLGGKAGVSDAFASALWGADYLLRMGAGGCAGVCFHGGAAEVEHANGEASQGARTAAEHKRARNGALYSPIAGTPASGYTPRPLYFGMQAASVFAGARMIGCQIVSDSPALTAYAARLGGRIGVMLINRSAARAHRVALGTGWRAEGGRRLIAPSLTSLDGVRFVEAGLTGEDVAVPPASLLWVQLRAA